MFADLEDTGCHQLKEKETPDLSLISEEGCEDCCYLYSKGRIDPEGYYCKLTEEYFWPCPNEGFVGKKCPAKEKE